MNLLLNIITSMDHQKNIDLIQQSILTAKKDLPIDFHWYWLCDEQLENTTQISVTCETSQHEGITKHGRINKVLDRIADGYVYFLDSDNLMHPELLSKFYNIIASNTLIDGIVVEQKLEDDFIRKVKPVRGASDPAQYILSRQVIADLRWHLDALDADGYFIEQIYDENADTILRIDEPLSFYKKADEYWLLQSSPKALTEGCIVVPDKAYYEENIKNSLNPVLRATLTHLARICGLKLRVIKIMGNVVNLLPLRASSICYKQGKGIVLIFETEEKMRQCLKPLRWSLE